MTEVSLAVIALVFVGSLGFVTIVKLLHARAVVRGLWDPADATLRRLMVGAAMPTLGIAIWFSASGLALPAAVVLGLLVGIGVLVASAGVLGVEGALVEPESAAIIRRAEGASARSSPVGRAIAIAIGTALATLGIAVVAWLG